jgi:hypothetical protein
MVTSILRVSLILISIKKLFCLLSCAARFSAQDPFLISAPVDLGVGFDQFSL